VEVTLFLVGLFVLLSAAVLVGEVMTRLGQAALVGQLAVGILLGPTLLGPYLGLAPLDQGLVGIQFLATFFILVMAGLDISPEEIWRSGASAAVLGVAIFVGPFLIGAAVVPLVYPGLPFTTALFVALTLSVTALPVMGIMLSEFRIGRTRLGALLLNAAVINELAAVTGFAILLQLRSSSGSAGSDAVSIAVAVVSVFLFLFTVLSVHMGLRLLRQSRRLLSLRVEFHRTWRSKEAGFAVLMVMALGAALYSQFLGLTFLVGAFYAGLLVTPESAGRRGHRSIGQVFDAMTWGFFIPLFFAFVGLGMDLRTLATTAATLAAFGAMAVFAIVSKLGVGYTVARGLGWSGPDARSIGFLVCSRGAVELAMAVILLQLGVFTTELYTVVAGVGLVTTVAAPLAAGAFGSLRAARRHAVRPSSPALEPVEPFVPAADPPA
jgi:Na+:H+ antiporter